ncbi:glycosyltransferase family 4 protein [Pseudobacteriovorax antillogorgiicola]|nr:glycosyltransferase family 4 protein [Pseudobacteriovorax antillogorgiicola]
MHKPTINFILPANIVDSLSRIALEWSNLMIEDHTIIISYPLVDHIDFIKFQSKEKFRGIKPHLARSTIQKLWACYKIATSKGKFATLKAFFELLIGTYKWQGLRIGNVHSSIRFNPFLCYPNNSNMPEADYIGFLAGNYLTPRLTKLDKSKGKVIASIHLNYDSVEKDPSPLMKEWFTQEFNILKTCNVPVFAESRRNMQVAERKGLKIVGLVPPGINFEEFKKRQTSSNAIINVMLFCTPKPQKGLRFGCEAIQSLRRKYSSRNTVKFISIGNVTEEFRGLFDENIGFCYGDDYSRALRRADIFVWPEIYSGFATPPLQAMASGSALCTTAIDGTEEYCIHMQNSMTCEPYDVDTMVNNISTLIDNRQLRSFVASGGLEVARRYTWPESVRRLKEIMRRESLVDSA